MFFGLESKINRQQDLFSPAKRESNSELYKAIDQINLRYGKGAIFTLGEGISKPWKMKRDLLSRQYTTNWEHLLKVK